jgi:predicted anti-sigma-YlaC factor YlaD
VHYPTDSPLLQDGMRVLTRTMQRTSRALGDALGRVRNRLRSVGRRVLAIGRQARSPETRDALVRSDRKLMATTRAVVRDAATMVCRVSQRLRTGSAATASILTRARQQLHQMRPLLNGSLEQTRARILDGDTHVPDKVLSIFEPHTEVIRKGKIAKPTEFGKLVTIQESEHQIITAYEVHDRRPADMTLWTPALRTHVHRLLAVALMVTVAPACSLKRIAVNTVANALAESGDTFASDPDPELIRAAVPLSLKIIESLLEDAPRHRGLLLTACSGFTQYAFAFVDQDAEMLKLEDYTRHARLQQRARQMYLRARDYCLQRIEVDHPGFTAKLALDPEGTAAAFTKEDVPVIYWTAASWGKAVALSLDRPALAGDFPIVRALVLRALALDESFNHGAIHEVMITLESLPPDMGGDRGRARRHYERAVELAAGNAAGPHVAYATGVLLPQQQRTAFAAHLERALRVDVERAPSRRLANLLAQEYARYLLSHLDELFLTEGGSS